MAANALTERYSANLHGVLSAHSQPWHFTSPVVGRPSYYLFGSGSAGLG